MTTPATFYTGPMDNMAWAPAGAFTMVCVHGVDEARVMFVIEFDWAPIAAKIASGADITTGFFSKGCLYHVTGANPQPFLAALATELGATDPNLSQPKFEVYGFEFAFLGGGLSRNAMGGFSGGHGGDWMATKLFLAGGAAEVYFNVDLETGEAEFSPKDPAYGTAIVEELSQILW